MFAFSANANRNTALTLMYIPYGENDQCKYVTVIDLMKDFYQIPRDGIP